VLGVDAAGVDSPGEPPSIADGTIRSLDPRYVDLQRQTGWITAGVLAVIAVPVSLIFVFIAASFWAAPLIVATAFGFVGLVTWWLIAWPPVSYRHIFYRVDADGLEIRGGVYFRSVTTVPKSRVQHTDVSQGPLQRKYGLATLTVHTAGTQNAQVQLPGLTHEVALRIRDHLLPGNTADAV
jgi:membrane protein YdbS with pleckstrin-like domain